MSNGSKSYGIIPWILVGESWYFLTQLSYSTWKYNLKLDPLRGRIKGDESTEETAVREVLEESSMILNFKNVVSDLGGCSDNLYHVQCLFSDEQLQQIVQSYNENRKILIREDNNQQIIEECVGIVWVKYDCSGGKYSINGTEYRVGSQLKKLLEDQENLPQLREKAPLFTFEKVDADNGVVSFCAISSESTERPHLDIVDNEDWKHSQYFRNRNEEEIDEILSMFHRKHLIKYPTDKKRMGNALGCNTVRKLLIANKKGKPFEKWMFLNKE